MNEFVAEIVPYHMPPCLDGPRIPIANVLNHSHGRGRRISVSLGVISPANCADTPVSDNPISSFIDIRVRHNKQKIEDLHTDSSHFTALCLLVLQRRILS